MIHGSGGTLFLGGAALVTLLAGGLGGYLLALYLSPDSTFDEVEGLEGAAGFEIPSVEADGGGVLSAYKREKQKRSALSDGTVRWHLVGNTFERPKYVKPKRKDGGNTPELEYEDETYLFPEDAAVVSEEEGVPVVVHREGEAEPINLRDGWDAALDASMLRQYLEARVTSQSPADKKGLGLGGMFGDMDSMDLLRYGILGMVALFIGIEVLSGGIV